MSYCRMGETDIYLFRTERGITCCACGITPLRVLVFRGNSFNKDLFPGIGVVGLLGKKRKRPWKKHWLADLARPRTSLELVRPDPFFQSRTAALAHIQRHRSLGDYVPDYVDERLSDEIRTIGDSVAPFNFCKPEKRRLGREASFVRSYARKQQEPG